MKAASKVGCPAMIKASEGGGGKGIRKVFRLEDMEAAFLQVMKEVPGSPILIQRLAMNARHLEVQVVADIYGNVASLHGRDCTLQRRHQKMMEEGPITIAPPEIQEQLYSGARKLAKFVQYSGAATVEYLYCPDDGQYSFLEINPRLQVEHPVTEAITGACLPAIQLCIAMGISLHQIPDVSTLLGRLRRQVWLTSTCAWNSLLQIRALFGQDPGCDSLFDFEDPCTIRAPTCHCVAVRITAENPSEGFTPTSGRITELHCRSLENVTAYFSIGTTGAIHSFADSQIGHVFARGPTRAHALKACILALNDLDIRGEICNNVNALETILQSDSITSNLHTTEWLDEAITAQVAQETGFVTEHIAIVCGAILCFCDRAEKTRSEGIAMLSRGIVMRLDATQVCTEQSIELVMSGTKYVLKICKTSQAHYRVILNQSVSEVDVIELSTGGLIIQMRGKSYTVFNEVSTSGLRMSVDRQSFFFPNSVDPSQLLAVSAGKLLGYLRQEGEFVHAGDAYAEVEVMKMVLPMVAEASGTLFYVKLPGSTLEAGDLVARLELDDGQQAKAVSLYHGTLDGSTPRAEVEKIEQRILQDEEPLRRIEVCMERVKAALEGFCTYSSPKTLISELTEALLSTQHYGAVIGGLEMAYPALRDVFLEISTAIQDIVMQARARVEGSSSQNAPWLKAYTWCVAVDRTRVPLSESDMSLIREVFGRCFDYQIVKSAVGDSNNTLTDFFETGAQLFGEGAVKVLVEFLKQFIAVEQHFDVAPNFEEAVLTLKDHKCEEEVFTLLLSHSRVRPRSELVLAILSELEHLECGHFVDGYENTLNDLSAMTSEEHNMVTQKAKEMLYARNQRRLSYATPGGMYDIAQDHAEMSQASSWQEMISEDGDGNLALAAELAAMKLRDLLGEGIDCAAMFHEESRKVQASVLKQYFASYGIPNVICTGGARLPVKVQLPDLITYVARTFDSMTQLLTRGTQDESVVRFMMPLDAVLNDDTPRITHQTEWNKIMEGPPHKIQSFIAEYRHLLLNSGMRTVYFTIFGLEIPGCDRPLHFAFSRNLGFDEDRMLRHFEPVLTLQMELQRLCLFSVKYLQSAHVDLGLRGPSTAKLQISRKPSLSDVAAMQQARVHYFYAHEEIATLPKMMSTGRSAPKIGHQDRRVFVRAVVYDAEIIVPQIRSDDDRVCDRGSQVEPCSAAHACNHAYLDNKNILVDILARLDLIVGEHRTAWNCIFINCVYEGVTDDVQPIQQALKLFVESYTQELRVARVTVIELKGRLARSRHSLDPHYGFDGLCVALWQFGNGRIVANNPSGYKFEVETYVDDEIRGESLQPYPILSRSNRKQMIALAANSTYIYDFPELFKTVLLEQDGHQSTQGPPLFAKELVLNLEGQLEVTERKPGSNDVGCVVWRVWMRTQEYPSGREIILVGNDITFQGGSLGSAEDAVFARACQLACAEGLPLVYISANAGARIGMDERAKSSFRVAWNEDGSPAKGYKYLYLTEDDPSIPTERIQEDAQDRYKIKHLLNGTGVESLQASGMIARAASLAYDNTCTITYVTGRSVGIGAYVSRLTRRVIQHSQAPLILTGSSALNKLLGRTVYSSNLQIGGPKVMGHNGVSQVIVQDDWIGVRTILRWLSYVPDRRGASLPMTPSLDSMERPIGFVPTDTYDVREMLAGRYAEDGSWVSGFFDKDSWMECMGDWGKTVVAGRARLGSLPCGVIAVEVRTVEKVIPADPGFQGSTQQTQGQAGCVWFPDSAHKTSQALDDFMREDLPVMIFPNWRGFAGGLRDMYSEVLKYGAMIVDSLRKADQPILCYLPQSAELRGGAWVVIDPSINPRFMSMYAADTARGNVLEPEGMIDIKFRQAQLIQLMHKLDPNLQGADSQELTSPSRKLQREKEKDLLPIYRQIATSFADLHDKPEVMVHKNAINDIVPWATSRTYFCYKLREKIQACRLGKDLPHEKLPS
eukprot:scaffold577_cov405-Prasinococcus_capsulatus_cf.AAC.15